MQVTRKNINRTHTLRRILTPYTKLPNPSPYTVRSEDDFRIELNTSKDNVDQSENIVHLKM